MGEAGAVTDWDAMKSRWFLLAVAAASFTAAAQNMERLAQDSGCTLCHAAWQATPADSSVPPPAPAWTDIARRYGGKAGAEDELVKVVLSGSGPQKRHWQGKISSSAMPPNAVEVSEADARALVRWILKQRTAP